MGWSWSKLCGFQLCLSSMFGEFCLRKSIQTWSFVTKTRRNSIEMYPKLSWIQIFPRRTKINIKCYVKKKILPYIYWERISEGEVVVLYIILIEETRKISENLDDLFLRQNFWSRSFFRLTSDNFLSIEQLRTLPDLLNKKLGSTKVVTPPHYTFLNNYLSLTLLVTPTACELTFAYKYWASQQEHIATAAACFLL